MTQVVDVSEVVFQGRAARTGRLSEPKQAILDLITSHKNNKGQRLGVAAPMRYKRNGDEMPTPEMIATYRRFLYEMARGTKSKDGSWRQSPIADAKKVGIQVTSGSPEEGGGVVWLVIEPDLSGA